MTGIMAKNSKLWRLKNGKVPKIPLKDLQLHCLDPMIADSKILDGKDLDSQSRVYILKIERKIFNDFGINFDSSESRYKNRD